MTFSTARALEGDTVSARRYASLHSRQQLKLNRREYLAVGEFMQGVALRVPLILSSAISSVLVEGESGTGKEVVADLFAASLPFDVPFIKVNCGAISPSLLESELFGHCKGAFTGATHDKKGLIESAAGGWLFLDEVATLSPSAQAALLRALENQEILRVGETEVRSIQFKLLSAANESLEALVANGRFRKDLWQRLREAEILLPPLRDRPMEIEALASHFCQTMPGGPYVIEPAALKILKDFSWKEGNIRELRNCLRAMTESRTDNLLSLNSIPRRIVENTLCQDYVSLATQLQNVTQWPSADDTLLFEPLAEKLLCLLLRRAALREKRPSVRALARALGLSRGTVGTRIRELALKGLLTPSEVMFWTRAGLSYEQESDL